jgi:hypothetical protein
MSRISGFDIRLEFGPDGDVDHVFYWDQEGCGHERAFSLGSPLDDVISYHLKHYRGSHRMTPPKRCPFTLADTTGGRYHCRLEPHKTGNHVLEVEQ